MYEKEKERVKERNGETKSNTLGESKMESRT